MTRILTIAFVALALAGCVSTPYGTMRSGDWAYVQSLPVEQQDAAARVYVEECRRWRRGFAENRTPITYNPADYIWRQPPVYNVYVR